MRHRAAAGRLSRIGPRILYGGPVMAKLMKDELFEAQLTRALGYAPYGGADAGECLAAAGQVTGTSLDSWHDA